jgi:hypothetical protein
MPAHYKLCSQNLDIPNFKPDPISKPTTAQGILNSKMRQKLSKSFNMRYWWMKDRIKQGQFNLIWAPGKLNLANYFTKHHRPWHHQKIETQIS